MRRLIPFLLAALFFVSCSVSCGQKYPDYTDPGEAAYIRSGMEYVIHAGGTLAGIDESFVARTYDGSNSAEGVAQCIDAGCEVIELDFSFTADGELACIHNWHKEYSADIENDVPMMLADFLETEIYANFTPLWLGDLAEILRENDGVYIVADIKDDLIPALEKIAGTCPDLRNRFVVQIYAQDQYDAVRDLGFEYVIFTLYRLDWAGKTDWRALGEFARKHPLIGFTFSYELCAVEGYVDGMAKSGVPLYIHTINGDEEQRKYFDMGIDGIYTDDVK